MSYHILRHFHKQAPYREASPPTLAMTSITSPASLFGQMVNFTIHCKSPPGRWLYHGKTMGRQWGEGGADHGRYRQGYLYRWGSVFCLSPLPPPDTFLPSRCQFCHFALTFKDVSLFVINSLPGWCTRPTDPKIPLNFNMLPWTTPEPQGRCYPDDQMPLTYARRKFSWNI